jgi:hypothetical protein
MAQLLNRGRRRSLRRAVVVECTLRSPLWDGEERRMAASDLSVNGMWIDTALPIGPGTELIVCFTPPGRAHDEKVWASARVARVGTCHRPHDTAVPAGIGVVFTYCSEQHLRLLARSLEGCPPRLPVRRGPPPLPA